ncbi:DNA topoisomerase 2 [Impatiens glandulifera]|uniref:DNA topoisomerase 2 n=1 Tax=Impatiens glandulifera TaxID=253017 RepID=UPI001FB08BE1|nr:DNA topoisomerase 2 [Impatiens glandulifera]
MVNAKKLPLQTSSNANVLPSEGGVPGKTIEETYQKKTQLEHILLRPDTYIGSIEKHTQLLWVYQNDEMVHRSISYVPGLYKIFDEILVNAADNKQRDRSMDSVKVVIDAEQNLISVYNNGGGVPVEIHQEEGVYVPEMIFGHLLTSSNYDDTEKKTTGGRNGYGAKLANIFSTEFVIETADGKRLKKYKQVFSNNMLKKSEPVITKCKDSENWTKVSFKPDLAKFNMDHLEEDVVSLMKKRVYDIAGCLGKTVKVELNGQRLPVKTFQDYVNLYLESASKDKPDHILPRIAEKVNDRWEICVSLSDGQFQQVSYVNGIATTKGGTHVDYVTNQITNFIMTIVNKKNKNANLKAHSVKNHLWVFVNALIDNPAFDSQTKETLTLRQSSFGSKCELSPEFLKKVSKSGIVENLLSWADFKLSKDLKKTDGTKRQRITGITKLEDANDAGGRNSDKCTLILTEGDSAKALAMAGIAVVGRNTYGVFPLRGKLLNVREASPKQIMDNAEIQSIKQILGLQHGKVYDSVKSLRYGHLMIMTDQDHDGSHIKGLLINFIHNFWPSLLKVPSFLIEFITPILKATFNKNKKRVLSFYTIPEYETWKESLGAKANEWTIKYYKGLGTSTSEEGKEYFKDIDKNRKDFVWANEHDNDAIELAFSKKKIEARKNWLRQFEPGTFLDHSEKLITYSDFVNKELILFSMADLQRSIPSMVDGLKPGQRKILFCAFKKNFIKEAKVAQFTGYVSEMSAYHHGETSLHSTIIGMAQDFVGSNNINLLKPNGQFGTRHQGGKDNASARYIYTQLSPITRFLFREEDGILLDYLNEDGQMIEPIWYIPIIPTVLVNGSEGIGTGWSSYVPNYNPRDIVANVKRLLNGEDMVPMDPWYKGFRGTIEKTSTKETGDTYTVSGIIEEVNETTLKITELPIRRWTQDYKEFLESNMTGNDKIKEPFIKDYREHNDDTTVHFEVILSEENLAMAMQEGLLKKFKLTTTISTSNMHLFDRNGVIKKYENPEQIIEDFFHVRLEFYVKRKKVLIDNLELDLLRLDNKVRFILGVVRGEIIVSNRKTKELVLELKQKGFTPFPKKSNNDESREVIETDETEESLDAVDINDVKIGDYDYLLSLTIGTLTLEKVQKLCSERDKLTNHLEEYRKTSPEGLWKNDLDALEKMLSEQDKADGEAEVARKKMQNRAMGNEAAKATRQPAKNPRKYTKKAASSPEPMETSDSIGIDNAIPEVVKPKGRAAPKKAAAPKAKGKASVAIIEEEDDEMLELKDRLAAYNLDSSPDISKDMEDKPSKAAAVTKKAPTKRAVATKKSSADVTEISDDDDDDDFEENKKGKKPAAAKPPAGPAAKKRGQQSKKAVITELLKNDLAPESSVISPEKKVRKMRASPFNKKSGSLLGRDIANTIDEGNGEDAEKEKEEESSAEGVAMASRARPVRANRAKVQYVLSIESDSEDFYDDVDDEEDDSESDDSTVTNLLIVLIVLMLYICVKH